MSDTNWQTVPVKHRSWATSSSNATQDTQTRFSSEKGHRNSAFSSPAPSSVPSSAFGMRKSKEEARVMPAAFSNSNKRGSQDDDRKQWQARIDFNIQRAHEEESRTLKEALTIESETEYPSLQPGSTSSPGSSLGPKKNSSLNFKAVIEAPASPNVPKITVIGGGKNIIRPKTPPRYEEDDEDEEDEFNAHIGNGRRGGGDEW